MRLRVFRVYQPITILGLGIPELFSAIAGFGLGMRLGDGGHPALPFLTGAVMGFAVLKVVERVRERYPGASLLQEVAWIGEADYYELMGDKETMPLMVREAEAPSPMEGAPVGNTSKRVSTPSRRKGLEARA